MIGLTLHMHTNNTPSLTTDSEKKHGRVVSLHINKESVSVKLQRGTRSDFEVLFSSFEMFLM